MQCREVKGTDWSKNSHCDLQGHEGLLCGSCSKGYGQYELSCFTCKHKGLIILWLLGMTGWTLFACSVAIAGNLTDTHASQSALAGSSKKISARRSSRKFRRRRNVERVNAPPVIRRRQVITAGKVDTSAYDIAKRYITESVKVLYFLTDTTF